MKRSAVGITLSFLFALGWIPVANAAYIATIHLRLRNNSQDESRPFEIRRGTVFVIKSPDGKFCQNYAVIKQEADLLRPGQEKDYRLTVQCISPQAAPCTNEGRSAELTPLIVDIHN
jgi:hypothetical protein